MRNLALITAFGVAIGGCSLNQVFAKDLSEVPVSQKIEYIFNTYELKENKAEANIEVLQINGLKDKSLESELNSKFMEQAQKLYNAFENQEDLEGPNFIGLDYTIKTDNYNVLSISANQSATQASSDSEITTYVIDKKNQQIVNLADLFKDNSYIKVISDNIKTQMRNQMKLDENIVYNIDIEDIPVENFESIKQDQTFYINEKNQLVIVFNSYEVAPGYMGTPEFLIPTNVIENILSDKDLIR